MVSFSIHKCGLHLCETHLLRTQGFERNSALTDNNNNNYVFIIIMSPRKISKYREYNMVGL